MRVCKGERGGGGVGGGGGAVVLLVLSGLFTHFYTYFVSNRPAASSALMTIGHCCKSKRK